MATGLRPVADARSRRFDDPDIDAAWQAIDCGFAAVADVFADCMRDAMSNLSADEMRAFLDAARTLVKLGRGADPVLAFLEKWPAVVASIGRAHSGGLIGVVMDAIGALQKTPNSKAIVPFLQTLAAVARRLPSTEQMRDYVELMLDLMRRTSRSIHGKHVTFESPGLPDFLREAPTVLGRVPLAGMRSWVAYGIRHHGEHPERQAEYFALRSPDSRAVLQRERRGTLFADHERQLDLYLRALWQDPEQLVPYTTAFDELRQPVPYYDALGMRVPDVLDDWLPKPQRPGEERTGRSLAAHSAPDPTSDPATDSMIVSGIDRYRAILAHMAGHRRWSTPQIADNWSPFQRLAVEFFEDARIDLLLGRRYPGLARILRTLHPRPVEAACNPDEESCLRHRLAMFSRACIDPGHGYADPVLHEFSARFNALLADGPSKTAAVAELALAWVARTCRPSDQFAKVRFEDTEVGYRDDNRHLWTFIEDSDDEDFFDDPAKQQTANADPTGLPPRRYPEWDDATQTFRPDWVSLYEALHSSGNAADIDALLERHGILARQLQRLLDLIKPQDKVRVRYQEEGSELDLDVALRALVDLKSGAQPETRINMSHTTAGRNVAVLVLLDLSESLNEKTTNGQTVLELSREAVSLLGWAIDRLGDPCAIAGFHSNTRHEVRYHHIKGFSERWDDDVKARLAAMQAGWSTRMGAALRHAGHYLSARRADRRILLVLTDGEPSDVDVEDSGLLRADARKAVNELSGQGISTFCLSLDPQADTYVSEIFGHRWRVLDRIEQLPAQLPALYLQLTK
jgi:nitric oxide reductase NorD protein